MNKAFQRKCIACNTVRNKYELIRILKTKQGEILIDKKGNLNGRGAYICKSEECLNKVIKSNKINKIFNIDVDKKIYDDIRGVIIDNEVK